MLPHGFNLRRYSKKWGFKVWAPTGDAHMHELVYASNRKLGNTKHEIQMPGLNLQGHILLLPL